MLVISTLVWLGWRNLNSVIPWPLVSLLAVGIVFACCVPLTALLARTPLAAPLTGRRRVPWRESGSRRPPEPLAVPARRLMVLPLWHHPAVRST